MQKTKNSEVSEKHKGKQNKLREKHPLKGKSFLRRNGNARQGTQEHELRRKRSTG